MRKVIRGVAWAVLVVVVGLVGLVGFCVWRWDRTVEVACPPIEADRSAAGIARGAAIFHSTCEVCHRGAGQERAAGAPLSDAPEFLGTFHSSNLTAHPTAGIGAIDDRHLARVIRYGVDHQGKRILMPTYEMGDADVAAVVGFLRSNDPLFAADATIAPRSKPSALGKTMITLAGANRVPDLPASGVPVPEKAATVAYGRYLAHAVYDCAGCHTPGWDGDKTHGPELFVGGFEFRDPSGKAVHSKNLTPDATGIAHYQSKDLAGALRRGVRPDGTVLSAPMPLFRGLEDVEVEALYVYLRSLAPRAAVGMARTPQPVRQQATSSDPSERFRTLGCVGCHGPGAAHAGALARAADKPAVDLARWIRNPERSIPGTPMPTYADLLDEPAALELATWIKNGGARHLAER